MKILKRLFGKKKPEAKKQFWPSAEDWNRINEMKFRDIFGCVERPAGTVYNSFSGVDTKVFIVRPDGYHDCLASVQAISWKISRADFASPNYDGSIVFVVFDQSNWPKLLENQGCDIAVYAANEYGCYARTDIKGVSFTELHYGIAVDDLISEETVNFSAKEILPWHHNFTKSPAMINKELMEQVHVEASPV